MIKNLIYIAILAAGLIAYLVYSGGGDKLKKLSKEVYETGESLDGLQKDMKAKEKRVRRKIKDLKEEFDGDDKDKDKK